MRALGIIYHFFLCCIHECSKINILASHGMPQPLWKPKRTSYNPEHLITDIPIPSSDLTIFFLCVSYEGHLY